MTLRVGDRFQDDGITWELVKLVKRNQHIYKVIACPAGFGYRLHEEEDLTDDWRKWTYLGNFAKSENAIDFYERIK